MNPAVRETLRDSIRDSVSESVRIPAPEAAGPAPTALPPLVAPAAAPPAPDVGSTITPARLGLHRHARTVGILAAYVAVFFGLLPLLLWTIGGRLDVALALPELGGPIWATSGGAIAILGVGWMVWSMVLLRVVGKGWPVSHLPPTRLVTSGPYRVGRHPIYVGYVTAAVGIALLDGSPGKLIACGLLVLGIVDYVLGYEGPGLRRRFTDSYESYRPSVRPVGRIALGAWRAVRRPVEWLANRPVLFRAGPTVWVTYGLFVAIGAGVSSTLLLGRLATDGFTTGALVGYILVVAPAMALGGRLLWFAVAWDQVRQLGFRRSIRTVGLVSWGTYIGFFAGNAAFAMMWQVEVLWLLDRTVPLALVCSVIGRIGCLTYGCCFGRTSPEGVRWHAPESKIVRQFGADSAEPRIPVQLLSATSTALAVFIAALVSLRPAPAGMVAAVVMLLYAMGRFAVDSYRDGTFGLTRAGGLTLGHVVSLLVVAIALTMLFLSHGPTTWSQSMFVYDWTLLWPLLPAITVTTVFAMVAAGYQWRKVGRW